MAPVTPSCGEGYLRVSWWQFPGARDSLRPMLIRLPFRPGPIVTVVRQCVVAVAMFAQCLMVIAPLADARETDPWRPSIASILEAGRSHHAVDTQHGHPHQHDPATCPACIAQTLHANLPGAARAPLAEAGERVLGVSPSEREHQPHFLSLQQSRAPPVAR